MSRLADLTLSQLLDALSSPEPTPGGGSAAAIAGAMATSLLMMVSGLSRSRRDAEEEKSALAATRVTLAALRQRLLTLADTDADAFDEVMRAYKLPKSSDDLKKVRSEAVQRALRGATEAPHATLVAVAEAARHARTVARSGNSTAASDVRVALELLEAAAAGATANVEVNLGSLVDESYRKTMAAAVFELTNQLTEHTAAARAAL